MSNFKVTNPATGETLTEIPLASEAEIKKTVQTARQAFDQGIWPRFSLAQRKEFLLKIAQCIFEHAQELAELETKNNGKPIKESTFMDVPSSAQTFEYFARNLERYLQPETVRAESGAESMLCYEPRGVVAAIVPWNYPLLIACWKTAQALACGNTVILKPSSLTPLTAVRLGEIIEEAGLPFGTVNVLCASGRDIGPLLCADKRIDMISFTGSTQTGREIMRFAAQSAKKQIMELGGKSASIVLADCDLETTVQANLAAIFLNQGQMCTAMSRILVDKKIAAPFIEQFTAKAKKIKIGNGLDPETQMGPLISREQRDNLLAIVRQAKKEGAKLLCGGNVPQDDRLKQGFFFEPAVFSGVTPEMAIFQQEAFGPVAGITEFSTEEEAVELANHSAFGLAGCVWSGDLRRAKELSRRIDAGIIWINTYGMFYNETPYGGFKQSGFGKELGKEGLREYSRLKQVNYDPAGQPPLVSNWYAF